jgi:hypothetical protein
MARPRRSAMILERAEAGRIQFALSERSESKGRPDQFPNLLRKRRVPSDSAECFERYDLLTQCQGV